ncbi:flap endonuclease GEN homolog 1 [Pholidichthys leucotaenia]
MGVQDLWSIVSPVRESVPLYSLSGKTLAVDLSLWVCEAQHVQAMMGRVTRPQLRNLFFRVSSLTLMGVKLVFVMEGEAPELKAETMSKRTESRYGGSRKAPAGNTSRGRFRAVLRECAEMLDYLGVPWVTAAGEAEAMCAYLDSQNLVDGCITNDGDAFLYGARTVYRNFNMNSKDPQVDCYQTARIQKELHLSRENLVGLAVLLGCDYIPKGVPGVGKEQALRLIMALKGQTLLQRFVQWKEESNDVLEVIKKVPHCNLCRHPGSAKAHERHGCVLCDSKHFCQPQDFDYLCPCDWHCYEQTRQALSFEANIKKKVLANQQFPFTEIINEFLVSKDKPVLHFKRRQPNMLMMQKFAFDKMEWPKHYTSEKVLVLMTYTQLMNRKCGRDVTSQIKPIRIFKPRVRNAVACFEVIWSAPEHYAFPDYHPVEDQHEVRTVEEESVFRVAYPDVVESYLREKALAEENKTKKKKSKMKKEKPYDSSEGISDLLAQMTLEAQPQTRLDAAPDTDQTDLNTPVNCKQHHNKKGDRQNLHASPTTCEEVASPSVSAVIGVLHLSNIDWDASSFTCSPQAAAGYTVEPGLNEASDNNIKECTERAPASVIKSVNFMECPLQDRVLMKNAAKTVNCIDVNGDALSKRPEYESCTLEYSSKSKPEGHTSGNCSKDSIRSGANRSKPFSDKSQYLTTITETKTHHAAQAQYKNKENKGDSRKPPHKYKFVRTTVSSFPAAPQQCLSSLGQSNNKDLSIKRSVCSSGEDSDVENQQSGPHRWTKPKNITNIKGCYMSDFPLKPVSALKPTEKPAHGLQLKNPNPQRSNEDTDKNSTSASPKKNCQDSPAADMSDSVFLQTPASPAVVLDSDDSVICSESPLPLAERLKLKFKK